MSSPDLLQQLARWAAQIGRQDAHAEALRLSRVLLLDTLGCALAARGHPIVRKAAKAADMLAGPGEVTGLGSGQKRAALGAVLDSGAAIRAHDFNDFYWGPGLGGHPSDMFAIALAVAEERDRDLVAMLQAVIVGYEIYLRLLDLMENGPFDHATAGAIGGAAIAATLIGLDEERFAHAISLAITRGPSLAAVRYGAISEVKGLAAAISCMHGLLAASLAEVGVSGPLEASCGPRGLPAFLRRDARLDDLVPRSGEQPRMLRVVIKRFPSMGTSQAAASAALALYERLEGNTKQIRKLVFRLADSPLTRHQITGPYLRPSNRETADHSFPAVIAMTLADGKLTPHQFESARYENPEVLDLIDRMTFLCDLGGVEDGSYPAEATAVLEDGTTWTVFVEAAPGHFRNPMTEALAVQKFERCAAGVLSKTSLECVSKLCLDPIGKTSVRDLIAALKS